MNNTTSSKTGADNGVCGSDPHEANDSPIEEQLHSKSDDNQNFDNDNGTSTTLDCLDPALLNEPERDQSHPSRYAEVAPFFEKQGNATVPIRIGYQRPPLKKWNTPDPATLEGWKEEYADCFTGILTGHSFPLDDPNAPVGAAFDNDISIPEASAEVDLAWRRRYGNGSMRMGRFPKWLRQFHSPPGVNYVKGVAEFAKFDAETGEIEKGPNNKPLLQKIELLGLGQQFVASAIHSKVGVRYVWLAGDGSGNKGTPLPISKAPEITPDEIALFIKEDVAPIMERFGWKLLGNSIGQTESHRVDGQQRDEAGEWFSVYSIQTDSEDDVRRYLSAQDAAADQTTVFANLAALYDWDNGTTGYSIALEWLKSSNKHTDAEAGPYLRQQWRFLERNRRDTKDIGPRRTIGHFKSEYVKSQEAEGNPDSLNIRQQLQTRIDTADSYDELRTVVVPAVHNEIVQAGDFLIEEDQELLAQAAKSKAKDFGVKSKIDYWRERLIPATKTPTTQIDKALADTLYDRYVYRESDERYIDLQTGEVISRTTLNIRIAPMMPRRNNGLRFRADEVLAGNVFGFKEMRRIVKSYYEVNGDPLRETTTGWEANHYRPGSFPIVDRPFDTDDPVDAEMADMIHRHLRLIADDDPVTAHALLQILAHHRQKPNTRIYWAFALLSETQGNGKSLYETLCKAALGDAQVATMAPRDLNDLVNAYVSEPVLMTFLQEPEAMPSGSRKRFNAADLKDAITADVVSVRRMYQKPVPEPVCTQFGVLSNYEGVLSKEAAGRRWLGVTIRARLEQEMFDILGTTPKDFFKRYAKALRERGSRAAAYLESVDLDGFDCHRVPETRHQTVHVNTSPLETVRALIREFIDKDENHDIGPDVINWRSVRQQIINKAGFSSDDPSLEVLANMPQRQLLILFRDAASLEGFVQLSSKDRNVKLPFEISRTVKASTVWYRRDVIEWNENRRPLLNDTAVLAVLRQKLEARKLARMKQFKEDVLTENRSTGGLH